jgi:adenylate cyclase class 2
MQTEIEAKWLDVDLEGIRRNLDKIGAILEQPERLMVRRTFDFPDKKLRRVKGWVRVRDEGDKITMSYKQLDDRSVNGTQEVNVTVDNFVATCNFLEAIGLGSKSYQETKRESWKLGDIEIELDTWPWIPSFVEIEAPNEKLLKETANKLGFEWQNALHGSVETAYQAVYNVTDAEIDSWTEIRFIPTPEWLEATRKQRTH